MKIQFAIIVISVRQQAGTPPPPRTKLSSSWLRKFSADAGRPATAAEKFINSIAPN